MRVSFQSPFTGIVTREWLSLSELEYRKEVEEIENEKFEMEQRRLQNVYPRSVLSNLPSAEKFTPTVIKHIFEGELNKRGEAVGYHYEGVENTGANVIPGTRTLPDKHGVYEGKVSVKEITKKAKSTFFPREWSPEQVVNAIGEAYGNRCRLEGMKCLFEGVSKSGITIRMFVENGKIKSAYPIKEK